MTRYKGYVFGLFHRRNRFSSCLCSIKMWKKPDGKNSQESSVKCSLLSLLSSPRHCTQSEIRIYCHFADDSRGSDLLSQKNNESSAQSTVKRGLWVALFPRLPIYLRTVKYIMSINGNKLTGRAWVNISNPEQIPDVFSEINYILTLLPFIVFI